MALLRGFLLSAYKNRNFVLGMLLGIVCTLSCVQFRTHHKGDSQAGRHELQLSVSSRNANNFFLRREKKSEAESAAAATATALGNTRGFFFKKLKRN
jgi:hypothetical protein